MILFRSDSRAGQKGNPGGGGIGNKDWETVRQFFYGPGWEGPLEGHFGVVEREKTGGEVKISQMTIWGKGGDRQDREPRGK